MRKLVQRRGRGRPRVHCAPEDGQNHEAPQACSCLERVVRDSASSEALRGALSRLWEIPGRLEQRAEGGRWPGTVPPRPVRAPFLARTLASQTDEKGLFPFLDNEVIFAPPRDGDRNPGGQSSGPGTCQGPEVRVWAPSPNLPGEKAPVKGQSLGFWEPALGNKAPLAALPRGTQHCP